MKIYFILIASMFAISAKSQPYKEKEKKFSFTSGFGLAGSFFVIAKDYAYNKNFLGTNLNFGLGYRTGKKSNLSLNFTQQLFSKKIQYTDDVSIFVDAKTRHFNNFFELIYDRKLKETKFNKFYTGIGIYYATFQQEEVDVGPGGIMWMERNFKKNGLEEGGALIQAGYEYKFQPKVNIGIKTQFYYTITAPEAESITLYPYVKFFFDK